MFADGAMFKHGNLGQGIYVDPGRDVVGVYFSTNGYIAPYAEDRMPGFIRRAAKMHKIQFPSDETQFGWVNISLYDQAA